MPRGKSQRNVAFPNKPRDLYRVAMAEPTERDEIRATLRRVRADRERNDLEERAAVLRARELEMSWGDIALKLGLDKSTVWSRYRRESAPPRPRTESMPG